MKTVTAPARSALIAILALALAPYLLALGSSSLWDSNEAFYAETPREMIEAGDFINPSFNYQPRFNKPPLSYWVVALSYKVFGVSELAERVPIALGAIALILASFVLARMIFSFEAAALAALALAISPRFLMFSRRIIIDLYLAMFMALALTFFALAERYPERRRRFLVLMYAALGFGVMTKGPVAIALPALVFLIYLIAFRQLKKIRLMMPGWGALIVASIVLPWYSAVYAQHGWLYIKSFLLLDNLSRYTRPIWGPSRGPLFYLPVLLGDMFPWSLLLPAALWLYGARSLKTVKAIRVAGTVDDKEAQSTDNTKERLTTLLLIWIAVIVIFFSLSRSKEDLYILPVYPAAAAIVGGLLSGFLKQTLSAPWQKVVTSTTVVLGLIIALAGATAVYLFGKTASYNLEGATVIGALAISGGVLSLAMALFRRRFGALAAMAIAVAAMNWVFVLRTLPDFERFKPIRPLCAIIESMAGPDSLVGYYRLASPSMVYYLRRPIFEYYREEELQAALSSGQEVYCVMKLQDYEAIKDSLPVPTYILASHPVFQVKLKVVFEKTGPPEVVIISNRDGASIR